MTKAVTDVELQKVYSLFFQEGEVVEIRALGLRGKNPAWDGFAGGKAGIVSGYFNDPEKFAAAAYALEKAKARGIYFTANPCKPALLSRAANRLICPHEENTTPDMYMACLRWFLIDLDAKMEDGTKRPKGVSATDEELKVCQAATETIAKYLEEEQGFARGLRAFSGNGYHLMYRLPDLPNNDEHKAMVRDALAALDAKFPDTVDLAVFNPGRIWKFYGTTGRKGDSTPERPHRRSYIYTGQPENLAGLPITELETFKKFAALAPAATSASSSSAGVYSSTPALPPSPGAVRMKPGELGPIDMEKYLANFGIAFSAKEKSDKTHGPATFYLLDTCLFNPDHGKGDAAIVVPRHGAIKYQCFHDSCKGRGWKDARRIISGDRNLAEFCHGFDPNWQPHHTRTGTGFLDNLPDLYNNAPALQNGIGAGVSLPKPQDFDPREFFEKKGRRPVFIPDRVVKYITYFLHPLYYTGEFYHYENGVWQKYSTNTVGQIISQVLKQEVQPNWIEGIIKVIKYRANRELHEWPSFPNLINLKNGMYNIETGEILPHSPEYGSFQQLPVNYTPDAGWSEAWQKFLKEIFYDDKDYSKIGLLQQFFGYCLLRDTRYQKTLFLYGTGANGKSTVLDVLEHMVGTENTAALSLSDLAQKFRPSFLEHKLVNLSSETSRNDPVESDMLKKVIDGSILTTEKKFAQAFQFRPYAKWIVAMNEAAIIPDKSYALERRILALYFNRRFEPHEIIERYAQKYLFPEIDGVFNWAVDGLRALLANGGFKLGAKVMEDTSSLMDSINPFRYFTSECLEISEAGDDCYEETTELWYAYSEWCKQGHNRPLGRNKFFEQVLATFMRVRKGREIIKVEGKDKYLSVFYNLRLTEAGQNYASQGRRRAEKIFDDKKY